MPCIHCGTFEPETHWRERDLATLPSLPDPRSARVVEAMDEMLFVFCKPGDRLLSARRMNDVHVGYLNALGFSFKPSTFDIYPADHANGKSPSNLFAWIEEQANDSDLAAFLPPMAELEPFAVVPGVAELVRRYGLNAEFPSQKIIRRVNTKSYSLHIRDVLGIQNVGILVESLSAFRNHGNRLLASGPYLVKDDYGVSGKGNQIVTQPSTLERLASYLAKQENKGQRVRFVLEPYLPKKLDFSCQFRISPNGSFTLISVQHLYNDGLAFGMSCSPGEDLLAKLDEADYFKLMERIGNELFAEGYFGDVCVDSMLLQDDTLSPIVEINARKSMSLIKHEMDNYLGSQARSGVLTSITASHDGAVNFADLLSLLQEKNLLFEKDNDAGILPLSSATLFPTGALSSEIDFRGRLYIEVVGATAEQRSALLAALAFEMGQVGFRVRS